MKILLIAQHYAPEEVSGAVLATELAEDLVNLGHEVTFVTCAPNYPAGIVFQGYKNSILSEEVIHGVKVVRTWSYISPRKDFLSRILNFGSFSLTSILGGLKAKKPDVIFSYSPPLTLGVSAWILSCFNKIPWILRVEDLYPDAAVAVGALRNPLLIQFFYSLERFLYHKADKISLISNGFHNKLEQKGIDVKKLSITSVWADPDAVHPEPRDNQFRQENGLVGKFVVLYAGALGFTSALEDVVEAADVLRDDVNVHFVIVGEGIKKNSLMDTVNRKGLRNVSFLPFQPRAQYSEMMAAADVSLVTLNSASSNFSLPNKIFNIMASERPILAVVPFDSEVAELVGTANCGMVVAPSYPADLAQIILNMRNLPEQLDSWGKNGRLTLETKFSRKHCIREFEQTLLHVVDCHA